MMAIAIEADQLSVGAHHEPEHALRFREQYDRLVDTYDLLIRSSDRVAERSDRLRAPSGRLRPPAGWVFDGATMEQANN